MTIENSKIYVTIRDAQFIPDKIQQQALAYIKLIAKSPHVCFTDSYDLTHAFSWHLAQNINAGHYKFWHEVNEYLNRQKER